eukprot:scaffold107405_cov30-Tisochrysis_lutea.AAC.2
MHDASASSTATFTASPSALEKEESAAALVPRLASFPALPLLSLASLRFAGVCGGGLNAPEASEYATISLNGVAFAKRGWSGSPCASLRAIWATEGW